MAPNMGQADAIQPGRIISNMGPADAIHGLQPGRIISNMGPADAIHDLQPGRIICRLTTIQELRPAAKKKKKTDGQPTPQLLHSADANEKTTVSVIENHPKAEICGKLNSFELLDDRTLDTNTCDSVDSYGKLNVCGNLDSSKLSKDTKME
ncbi:hypothetical protein LSTR_LSTR013230 [Laodelphax striatellus]|uniref:Uncharacterized protein n=1 Tax=Laodelphax striatellus TaxID=195883 RepID=A0A482X9Q6_LAOST|nr:hypothetical protein LSTR_LSTR013230 [Laodelphax striatellus]